MGYNTMSKDRVHITIRECYIQKQEIRDCIAETFGIQENQLPRVSKHYQAGYKDLHVVCRPSQFARFVILRHVKYGQPNNMACLNMKLVLPEPEVAFVDASKNPNTAGGTPDGS